MSCQSYVYQSIARATKDHGISTMFGLMGDANLFMVDSFVRDFEGRSALLLGKAKEIGRAHV